MEANHGRPKMQNASIQTTSIYFSMARKLTRAIKQLLLGITIDQKLFFVPHVEAMEEKAVN